MGWNNQRGRLPLPIRDDWLSSRVGKMTPRMRCIENENTRKSVFEQHTYRQAENLRKSQSPRVDKINWNGILTQKLGNGFEFNKKACFVCGSLNHLIKDLVVTKSGQVPVNIAKKSSSRAAASISTTRPVNTDAPKSKGNPQYALQDQGIFDSGCSRHMTGNKSYLIDYQDVDGGFVAFAGSPKGGSGPEWLFDIDSLTKSMNYEPVTTGNQTNGDAGIETNVNTGQARQEKASDHEYILLPLMLSNSPLSSSTQSTDDKDVDEVPDKGDDDKEGYANNTNRDSTASLSISTAETSINTASENINTSSPTINTASPIPNDSSIQSLENTGIFDDAYDDREIGVEVDLNNLETTMNVSPIPTTIIHKDHPKDQIMRDINSATQTRRMTKIFEEHAMVSYIKKQRRTNHKDYQNCLFACFLSQIEPKKVIQALTDLSWIEAMQEELLQFKLQKVWTLVNLPKGKRAIGTKWAFAPVARIEAIGLFLAYASFMGLIVYQIDVNSAFLYGTIEDEVYVCQPPGFEDPQFPDKVYKVEKALYGLHQAPRAWYETLSTYLLENGYRRGTIDKTLFIKKDRSDILLVQVYIDDIIFGSTKKSLCVEFEQMMHKRVQMSSIGELTFFLGLQVQQKEDGIFISQDKYVADILKKFNFVTVKTTSTPMEPNKALVKDEEAEDVDVHLYRSMIGSLMYLTASRPDITFVVCASARFQVTPKISHLHAVKRIFRYLKG
ncbi:putative ribonuclease H-like domain-containing protein [Tanacetum coccineum]